jgi:protein SCO1/2
LVLGLVFGSSPGSLLARDVERERSWVEAAEAAEQRVRQSVKDADTMKPEIGRVTVEEHLGEMVPLDTVFLDEYGRRVTLADYFREGRPVILSLNYYRCPMLCTLVMNGLADGIKALSLTPHEDFQVITVSIDPAETPALARMKKGAYIEYLEDTRFDAGWAFLTGEKHAIDTVAGAVGFGYEWVPSEQQYAHPAVLILLSPDGKITRYLYGIRFDQQTLRLSLVEASEGKVGSTLDRFLLTCFHFDPDSGAYQLAMGVMRLGGMLTVGAITLSIGGLLLWEYRRRQLLPVGVGEPERRA